MTTYRGWRVYGPDPVTGLWSAVKGRDRVTAGSAMALRVVIEQQSTGGRVFDTGPV